MKVSNGNENFFKARRWWGSRVGAMLVAGAAMIALAAMMPAVAHAVVAVSPTVTLSPTSALNFTGQTHTVSAQVSGICSSNTSPTSCTTDGDCAGTCVATVCTNTGGACSVDADCASSCDFSAVAGKPIGIGVVSGVNSGASAPTIWTTVAPDGTATAPLQYSSSVVGVDTIQGCLDTDTTGGNDESTGTDQGDLAMCIADNGSGTDAGDFASNQVTKTWTAALTDSVVLSPLEAVNADNPAPKTHTVTVTLTGLHTCENGTSPGKLCVDDFACGTNGTCTGTDLSGQEILLDVLSGPNEGDIGSATTDAAGIATKAYTSNGVAGLDTIQACLDADSSDDSTADECLAETTDGFDPASNTVTKRWDPTLTLQNLDAGATLANGTAVYTTSPAYNPVGSSHTVKATLVGAAKICFGDAATNYNSCTDSTTCGAGTCGVAGYPVFFGVVSGPNAGDLGGAVLTNSTGVASKTYTDIVAGVDTIQACVDADTAEFSGGVPDDSNFSGCLADYQGGATTGQADVPSNTVLKTWLNTYVTGGGKVSLPNKAWDTFGGTVGYKPNSTALTGEWTQQAHAKGTLNCHWNAFSKFALSCSTSSCGATPDTVVFTTTGGSSSCGNETVKIVDGQKKPDTIQVTSTISANNVPGSSLVSGNFTIHK